MPLPYPKESANSHARAKQLTRAYSDEAADKAMVSSGVAQHESALHRGAPKTKLKLASGGCVDGNPAKPRMDRAQRARGGRAGKKATHVNVVVNAAQPAGAGAGLPPALAGALAGGPPLLPPPPMAGPPAMPPKPMGPMPGPMGGPPGGMPMRARGGRAVGGATQKGPVKAWTGDKGTPTGQPKDSRLPPLPLSHPAWDEGDRDERKNGGKVYTAGAYSGEGKLQKIKNYGANAKIKNTTVAVKGVKGEDA